MVPLQFSAYFPRSLTNEPQVIGGVFDWSKYTYSETQKADRAFYLQCVTHIASKRQGTAQVYADIMARADQEDRQCWLNAVCRVDIMRALADHPHLLRQGKAGSGDTETDIEIRIQS
ncbi:hypothetical protein F5Y16DRAFT_374809 [Xylariaceae sp. FL0255]|nr:hypothetical protein F5Y16DRAFT_374809 [Xylariaceae sp. FL0255]